MQSQPEGIGKELLTALDEELDSPTLQDGGTSVLTEARFQMLLLSTQQVFNLEEEGVLTERT